MDLKIPKDFNINTIEVTDDLGRVLMTYGKHQEQLNLQNLETGNYRVKIIGERGIKVFKIVIE